MPGELAAARLSGDCADVRFTASDGECFPAHACILALRSSTLRALLVGPLAKRQPCMQSPPEFAVPGDIAAGTFRTVLHFLYTDELRDADALDVPALRSLLAAVDFLDVPRLRDICEARLHAALAPDNAVAALKLATALSCLSLRDAALRFIAANVQAVMSADWASLPPELVADITHTLAVGEPPCVARTPPDDETGGAAAT